jgi:hypothetical protein
MFTALFAMTLSSVILTKLCVSSTAIVAAATTVAWPSTARFDAVRVPTDVITPVPVILMVDDVDIVTPSMVPLLMSTFVMPWLPKSIAPAAVKAPIFAAARVSPLNVRSASPLSKPSVLYIATRPDTWPSAVNDAARRLWSPMSMLLDAVSDVMPSMVPLSMFTFVGA